MEEREGIDRIYIIAPAASLGCLVVIAGWVNIEWILAALLLVFVVRQGVRMGKRFVFDRPSDAAVAALVCAAWWVMALFLEAGLLITILPLIVLAVWRIRSPLHIAATALLILPFVVAFEWALSPPRLWYTYDFRPSLWDGLRPYALWLGLAACLVALAWHFRLGRPLRIGRVLGRRARGAPCGTCAMNAVDEACLAEEAWLRNRIDWLVLAQRVILLAAFLGFAIRVLYAIDRLAELRAGSHWFCPWWEPVRAIGLLGMALPAVIVLQVAHHHLRARGIERLRYARSLAVILMSDAADRLRAKGPMTAKCCVRD